MAFFAKPQSTAVKIVDPTTQDESKSQTRKDSVQRQCRNVLIYGYVKGASFSFKGRVGTKQDMGCSFCKFENKGCVFSHPTTESFEEPPLPPASPLDTRISTLTPKALNAPVFVPKAAAAVAGMAAPASASPALPSEVPPAPSVTSPTPPSPVKQTAEPSQMEYQDYQPAEAYDYGYSDEAAITNQMEGLDPHFYDDGQYGYASEYDPSGMDSGYYPPAPPVFLRQPLNYHLYTPVPPPGSTTEGHFVPRSSDLRQILQHRGETILGIAPTGLNLPEELQGYHTLVPLEGSGAGVERRKLGNWYSTVYRAIRSSDGMPYALRRIENYRMTRQAAFAAIEIWSRIEHPGIITVKEAFTTRSFNDNSLVVVHAYHADAQTLFEAHIKPKPPTMQTHFNGRSSQLQANLPTLLPERTLWSYVVQIASAIKKVHDAGQAVRMIDASKILVTGRNRVRISSCGIIDVLMHETPQDMGHLQQEDLTMFGRLLFALCCNNLAASSGPHFQKSLEFMGRNYSSDVKNAALFLISKGGPHRSIEQLLNMIHGRVLTEMDEALHATDRLEHELLSELENARLVRLLCKFGFINERPEFAREPRWSETGDRYIIKLFRDYVFHQVDENNNPVVNLSHVLTCLNKLDVGTDEKIMLVARDEQSCLVVSYKEIKLCIDSAFGELSRGSSMSTTR